VNLGRIDEAALDRAYVARFGFAGFVKVAWSQVVGEKLRWNWHHDIVCACYEAVLRGQLKELVLNVPPGHTKSLITSVFLPAFAWGPGKLPSWKALYASFDMDLSRRDSTKCKDLLTSRWYQERWGFLADQGALRKAGLTPVTTSTKAKAHGLDDSAKTDSATIWYNSSGGMRMAVSVAGKGTGWHAHAVFVDDPTKPLTIKNGGDEARKALADTVTWWDGTMASRRVDPGNFAQVVIMQRLHTEDLAGVCIKRGYTAVVLPAEFDPSRRCVTPWGSDPRTQPGELLWPEHVTPEALASLKKSLGGHAVAQLQQNPIPDGGSIFRPEHFRNRWKNLPRLDKWWQSWDCSFSEDGASYVVGQVWGKKGPDYYLIDQVRRRMGFTDTCDAIETLSRKWPKAKKKLVEKKANGAAVIDHLRRKLGGFVPIEPEGGKVSRANRASDVFETGNVYLPAEADWLQEYIDELLAFPQGSADDQVDCTSQSINYSEEAGGGAAGLLEAYG
jgi:predicted phage terminase large subunit-like protein